MRFPTSLNILKNLVLRNLKVRYKGSLLGVFWVLLNPLFTMLVLYIVFSCIVKMNIKQYPLFLLSAILPWSFFSSSLTDASRSIIDDSNLVKKVYFPREVLPLSYVISNFINFLFSLIIILTVLMIFRIQALKYVYYLPLILIIHLVFTLGLALVVSCANVYFRDIGHILGIMLIFWFYMTPIFYPASMIPSQLYRLYLLNPMASIINIYRDVLFEGNAPSPGNLLTLMLFAGAVSLCAYFIFKKYENSFAKVL